MRAVTYNVRGFRDGRGRVAAVVRELAPDVLLLQETGSRRDLRRFADEVGMRVAHDPWSPLRRRVKNAVLVTERWRFTSIELIRFPEARRWYPRGALVARATAHADAIWAVSVHLGLEGAERAAQAASLTQLVSSFDGGLAIVGGDLNATPDMRATARIAAALRDCWTHAGHGDGLTFPASAPAARIDYVFVGDEGTIISAAVGAEGASEASDHLPVAVDLRLKEGRGASG
ncbi:MAG: endonuclease/exonuclease/phosphatase family protein [Actinomycetota bacterium]